MGFGGHEKKREILYGLTFWLRRQGKQFTDAWPTAVAVANQGGQLSVGTARPICALGPTNGNLSIACLLCWTNTAQDYTIHQPGGPRAIAFASCRWPVNHPATPAERLTDTQTHCCIVTGGTGATLLDSCENSLLPLLVKRQRAN